MVGRSKAILNVSADTEISNSARAFHDKEKTHARPKLTTVKKTINDRNQIT